jgi:hypothetical protein
LGTLKLIHGTVAVEAWGGFERLEKAFGSLMEIPGCGIFERSSAREVNKIKDPDKHTLFTT